MKIIVSQREGFNSNSNEMYEREICNNHTLEPLLFTDRLITFLDFLQNELQPELIGDISLLFYQNLWI